MKHFEDENEEFRKYREQMHGADADEKPIGPNNIMRSIFALIMVIVYIGVGVLLCINFFRWNESIDWIRWIIGIVLIIYGAFRAFRYIKGIDR